jgi:geranylgeranyl diphosphate synthase type II
MLKSYFESRAEYLDEHLKKIMADDKDKVKHLNDAMNYSIFSGGKRLRPILFFAIYEMLTETNDLRKLKPVLPVAYAIEMIHTASLIHDDLPCIDNSKERRNLPTCHIKFGTPTAILAGDAFLTKAFEMLTLIENKDMASDLISVLCNSVSTGGMIGGQTVEVISSKKNILPLNVLKYIHNKKTGSLLEAAAKMACICGNASKQTYNSLSNFATNLGLAYQIIDDILDDIGAFEFLGKEPYEDVRNNRTTYPTIMGLDKAKKMAEKLIEDAKKFIKNMKNNDNLIDFIKMIEDRLF